MQAKQHISLLERTTSLCYCYSSLPHTFILIILYKTPRVSQTTSLPNKYLKGKVERSSRCSRAGQKSFLKNLHKIHFDFKYEVFLMDMIIYEFGFFSFFFSFSREILEKILLPTPYESSPVQVVVVVVVIVVVFVVLLDLLRLTLVPWSLST